MSILLVFVVLMVVSLAAITLISAWERRLVWPYVPAQDAPPDRLPDPDGYAYDAASTAAALGFAWRGTFADGKGKMYRVRYDFFRSPDGVTLALVGTGTVASIPLQTTWLFSRLADGRCLVTFDHQNGGEIDLAGLLDELLIAGRGFDGLVAAHQTRLAGSPVSPQPFSDEALPDWRAFRERRVARLVEQGYAAFLDAENAAWRYSLGGAAQLAFRQYFKGLRRAVVPDKVRPAP